MCVHKFPATGILLLVEAHHSRRLIIAGLPVPTCGDGHLGDPADRVPTGLHVPVPQRPAQEQQQRGDRGGGGRPGPERPPALVLDVAEEGVGEEGTEIEREVEVAEEGDPLECASAGSSSPNWSAPKVAMLGWYPPLPNAIMYSAM
jgi:hypothetical protein